MPREEEAHTEVLQQKTNEKIRVSPIVSEVEVLPYMVQLFSPSQGTQSAHIYLIVILWLSHHAKTPHLPFKQITRCERKQTLAIFLLSPHRCPFKPKTFLLHISSRLLTPRAVSFTSPRGSLNM